MTNMKCDKCGGDTSGLVVFDGVQELCGECARQARKVNKQ